MLFSDYDILIISVQNYGHSFINQVLQFKRLFRVTVQHKLTPLTFLLKYEGERERERERGGERKKEEVRGREKREISQG